MSKLAVPVVLAELGWVLMSIVDTMMVGRLGAEAIGAVSLGSSLFLAVAIFGIGLLLGLDTLVSQAFGAGKLAECTIWLVHGVYLSLMITVPLSLLMLLPISFLDSWGTEPKVQELTIPYLEILTLSVFPLFLYATCRRYLQALSRVSSIMAALISANIVNAIANWILIFGNLGAPELGVEGAGWATLISRSYMALFLLVYIIYLHKKNRPPRLLDNLRYERGRIPRLTELGFPAALQLTLEVGVFALATALASRLDAVSLASHQIGLSTASFTFMIPLGISAAGAVRVGQAIGRRRPDEAMRSGWTALLLAGSFMALAAIVLFVVPEAILRLFTSDSEVIAKGASLLAIAAVFQVFDGLQVTSTGVLRGMGQTKIPMVANLICHWFLGLPMSITLCFFFGWGVLGLWIGLCIGLIAVAVHLVRYWSKEILNLQRQF